MNRLTAYLKKKAQDCKIEIRIKKIEQALQTATTNAEEQKLDGELKLQSIMESMADTDNLSKCITEMSAAFDDIDQAEATLKRIERMKAYFNEEVETEEKKK